MLTHVHSLQRTQFRVLRNKPVIHFHLGEKSQRQKIREILRGPAVQPKLKVGAPNDKYEQEADRVAEQVMRMPEPQLTSGDATPDLEEDQLEEEGIQTKPITPLVQRQESVGEGDDEELIQTKTAGGVTPEVTPAISASIQSLRGGGRPLSRSERSFFEPRFGRDFSEVRVHSDARAASLARSIHSRAFTFGRDIVLGAGEHSADTLAGKTLLAHELTHVVQQNGGTRVGRKSAVTSSYSNSLRIQRQSRLRSLQIMNQEYEVNLDLQLEKNYTNIQTNAVKGIRGPLEKRYLSYEKWYTTNGALYKAYLGLLIGRLGYIRQYNYKKYLYIRTTLLDEKRHIILNNVKFENVLSAMRRLLQTPRYKEGDTEAYLKYIIDSNPDPRFIKKVKRKWLTILKLHQRGHITGYKFLYREDIGKIRHNKVTWTDNDFRVWLKTRILQNWASGDIPENLAIDLNNLDLCLKLAKRMVCLIDKNFSFLGSSFRITNWHQKMFNDRYSFLKLGKWAYQSGSKCKDFKNKSVSCTV